MARRFLRPIVTVFAVLGLVAVGAILLKPDLAQVVFTQKTPTAIQTSSITIPQIIPSTGDTALPENKDELDVMAAALQEAQAAQEKSLSEISTASGETAR